MSYEEKCRQINPNCRVVIWFQKNRPEASYPGSIIIKIPGVKTVLLDRILAVRSFKHKFQIDDSLESAWKSAYKILLDDVTEKLRSE